MTSVTATAAGTRRLLRVPTAARLWPRAGLATLVGALVVGILGMHALASHGTPAVAAAPAPAASPVMTGMSSHAAAIASSDSHEGHAHAAPTTDSSSAATTTGVPAGASHDMASMVMLCVVMLAAAALTLLGVLAAGIFRPLLPSAFKPAAVRERTWQWVRGTGPPSVWQFSVIRC